MTLMTKEQIQTLLFCTKMFLLCVSFFVAAFSSSPPGCVLTSNVLPSNTNLNATIGNGFLATAVGSDTVFLAGVFNGKSDVLPSRRARVPGFGAFSMQNRGGENDLFSLDLSRGVFVHTRTFGSMEVTHTTFAHRTRRELIINRFCLTSGAGPFVLDLSQNPGPSSGDFADASSVKQMGDVFLWTATTQTAESYLCNTTIVACLFSAPAQINLTNGECADVIAAFASSLEGANATQVATSAFAGALQSKDLLAEHEAAWAELRVCERFQFSNATLEVAQATFSSLYYLLSSVRADWPYSLSPGGLASNGYNGHSFWDCETFMAPTLLLFWPDIAHSLLEYRINRLQGYENKALSYNPPYKGLCVAWESAQTGYKLSLCFASFFFFFFYSPKGVECCPLSCHCAPCEREIHINGDVALFASQYFALTGNMTFLNRSFDFFDRMSQFWVSRSSPNSDGSWSILDVLPPDEYADHANDSYYTNVGAAFTLNFTVRVAALLGIDNDPRFEQYSDVASKLRLLYDSKLGVHLEYDKYKPNQVIKQAGKDFFFFFFIYYYYFFLCFS